MKSIQSIQRRISKLLLTWFVHSPFTFMYHISLKKIIDISYDLEPIYNYTLKVRNHHPEVVSWKTKSLKLTKRKQGIRWIIFFWVNLLSKSISNRHNIN